MGIVHVCCQRSSLNEKVKVKVVPALCLTEHHATKVYWGSGSIALRFL
jgi:hypothetical protein